MDVVAMRSDDRLSSRTDKILFFAIFIVGTAFIIGEKLLPLPRWVPMATGVLAILVYSGLAWRSPRFRLREDRIGDGAYYLGFLFTLVSLAISLWEFTDGGVESVLSGFGLALATTVVGLSLRVVFQQLRDEPIEFEQEARATLSESVGILEREIRLSVENLVVLRNRTQQEIADAVGIGMARLIEQNRATLETLTDTFRSSIAASLEGVRLSIAATEAQAAEMKVVNSRLVTALARLTDRIDKADSPTEVLRPKIDLLGSLLDRILTEERERAEKQRVGAELLLAVYERMHSNAKTAAAIVEEAKGGSIALKSAVESSASALNELSGILAALSSGAAKTVEEQFRLAERLKEFASRTEADLGRLREAFGKQVHESAGALTEMQSQIVDAAKTVVRELHGKP